MNANGHVIPGTPIAIDIWNTKNHPQAQVFFLSHFHADHIVGLTSAWESNIYTSHITGQFLIHKLHINPNFVKCLDIGEDHLIPLDREGQEMATVTLFDANHCPGSVMFLLSGYFGDILYTGDFRYKPGLLDGFHLPPIDILYLDNTYCSPMCVFPTREDAIERTLSQLSDCLVQSKRVFLGLDTLGKEELLERIFKERKCKVNVYPSKKEILDILGLSNLVTTTKSDTNIFVVPTNQISSKNIENWNREMPTHAIVATARFCGFKYKPFSKYPEIHVIPFSNHSSYFELKDFVKSIKPRTIVPIVGKHVKGIFGADISDRADMSVFQQFLRESSLTECIIPESVKKLMNECETKSSSKRPVKRRKVAKPQGRPKWRKSPAVGVRYIVSEDSETDSDPDAIHIQPSDPGAIHIQPNGDISEYSSSEVSDCDSKQPSHMWEITLVTAKDNPSVYYVQQ